MGYAVGRRLALAKVLMMPMLAVQVLGQPTW